MKYTQYYLYLSLANYLYQNDAKLQTFTNVLQKRNKPMMYYPISMIPLVFLHYFKKLET